MANESTTTTLSDLLPSIVAEALFQAEEQSIMRGLVRNYAMPMNSGKQLTVPKYGPVAAEALTEGTDLGNTQVSTTSALLTVAEVGVMTTVTDLALRTSASNVIADLGGQMGRGIAKKMDQDLVALFDGFSVTLGTGADNMTAAALFEAVARLRAAAVPSTDLACVLHPEIAYDLKKSMTSTFGAPAGDLANQALVTGFVGMIAGVPVYESANIASVAGASKGAVFHRDALGLATMQDIQIEVQRDASLRADELVATAVYGVGELFDTYGVELNFDSSIV